MALLLGSRPRLRWFLDDNIPGLFFYPAASKCGWQRRRTGYTIVAAVDYDFCWNVTMGRQIAATYSLSFGTLLPSVSNLSCLSLSLKPAAPARTGTDAGQSVVSMRLCQ
jgi:hypothetical protein